MPEQFDDMRDAFRHDLGLVKWADATQVQRQGTRRTYRAVAIGGLATLLVIAGGVGAGAALVNRDRDTPPAPPASATPSHSPSPSPSASAGRSPSPEPSDQGSDAPEEPTVEIPDSVLLQPEDVGPGYQVGSEQGAGGDWVLAFLFSAMACDQGVWTDAREVAWKRGQLNHDSKPSVFQAVDRFKAGGGRAYLTDLIAVTDRCRQMKTENGEIRLTIVDHDFAGEASILIRVDSDTSTDTSSRYHVFVRQGDLVTEIAPLQSEQQARQLANKAAARLCDATPSC